MFAFGLVEVVVVFFLRAVGDFVVVVVVVVTLVVILRGALWPVAWRVRAMGVGKEGLLLSWESGES